jgi:uncharacterized protein YecE (DUF72 family)
VFYPANLDPGRWLHYYSRRFGCCELGFTCYRLPEISSMQEMADETQGTVQFVCRVPLKLTEERQHDPDLARRFAASLWPLKDAGALAGVLAQFPPEFGFIRDNFNRLCVLRDSLEGIPLITEFGCPDWLCIKAARHLSEARVALACIDGGTSLAGKTFFCSTAALTYVRFQGRNQSKWIRGDGSTQHNYLYSRAELAAAVPEIRRLEQESERVLVFMNNHWRGQAVINAQMLMELIKSSIANDQS